MKTIIYYFTGTGNSLHVAKDLAQELGDCDLIPIPKALKNRIGSSDAVCVGFVFPVYSWGLPRIAVEFVKQLAVKPSVYYFGLATFGGSGGLTIKQLDSLLKEKGAGLSAGWMVQMPGNYTPLYGAPKQKTQEKYFNRAAARVKEIAAIIRNRKTTPLEKGNFLVNLIGSKIFYSLFNGALRTADKKYYADEKCDSCRICATVCPVDNIIITEGKPVWQHHCEQCLACLQWCPQEAIQFGKATRTRKRYHHPDIRVVEIAAQK
jgi:Pyruvate/2-oxoacid:ferredoxin oxidoreductase delta subunit/flavodoxin